MEKFSLFIDKLSAFFAAYKGLLPITGILMVIGNFVISVTSNGFMAQTNLLLHLGIVVSVLGIILGWAL